MIPLDTNIVSEMMKTRPAEAVVTWLNGQDSEKHQLTVGAELGLPMSVPNGQIAAIARRNHLAVATRNVLDFEHCGTDVLNPSI